MCFQQYFIEHTTLLMLYHMKKKTIKALPRFLQTSIQSLPEVKISERTCQIQIMEPNFPIHNIISNVENHIIMLLDVIISMGFAQFVHIWRLNIASESRKIPQFALLSKSSCWNITHINILLVIHIKHIKQINILLIIGLCLQTISSFRALWP